MKWRINRPEEHTKGSWRVVRKFLWFPKKLYDRGEYEIRWLEFAFINQEWLWRNPSILKVEVGEARFMWVDSTWAEDPIVTKMEEL